jgi:hypothetical protein
MGKIPGKTQLTLTNLDCQMVWLTSYRLCLWFLDDDNETDRGDSPILRGILIGFKPIC